MASTIPADGAFKLNTKLFFIVIVVPKADTIPFTNGTVGAPSPVLVVDKLDILFNSIVPLVTAAVGD